MKIGDSHRQNELVIIPAGETARFRARRPVRVDMEDGTAVFHLIADDILQLTGDNGQGGAVTYDTDDIELLTNEAGSH